MIQSAIVKIYGHIYPCDRVMRSHLADICRQALPQPPDAPVARQEGDMTLISFEGVYFPVEDILRAIRENLRPCQQGRLDVIDIESWRLTRHIFANGKIETHAAPLDNVLDYSGH